MNRFLVFLIVGSLFATIEEFLTIVVLKNDIGSYVFTLLILFPVFLSVVWTTSLVLERFYSNQRQFEVACFFIYGMAGLMIEWFLIGLSPWSNPEANPIVMLIFQLGMFSFWATVAFAPRLFLDQQGPRKQTRLALLRFYIPYFALVYVVGIAVPQSLKFVTIIPLVLFGYLFLNVFYFYYFRSRS